jgi:hypothetical protein
MSERREPLQRYAVVVDGYHIADGDDRGLASAFRSRDVLPITVLSTPEPLSKFASRWFPDDFAAVHRFDGDLDELVATVKGYDPLCIVPGNEHGVELAATLVETLMPEQGNAPGSAVYHRDKGAMVGALEQAGVPALRTICTDDPEAVAAWISRHGLAGRSLVVKPPKSSGTDNVHLVGDDWRRWFDHVLGATNGYGEVNDQVVVQEHAQGTEYIVDLYSVDGQHGLVDGWVYTKRARGSRIGIYDTVDVLPPDHPDLAVLADYVMRAADAVGIRNGSTHAEVMLTADGPRLIELAARHSGSCMMIAGSLATGDNQIDRTVRHRVDGAFTPGFELRNQVRTVWLSADTAGVMRDVEILDAALALPTVQRMSVPRNGQPVAATYSKSTALGWIIQVAPDWAAIEADYVQIRALEKSWNAHQSGGDVADR